MNTNEQTEWRPLEAGEIIQDGDEYTDAYGAWHKATRFGLPMDGAAQNYRTRRPRPDAPSDAPTPETDAEEDECNKAIRQWMVPGDFARRLERDLIKTRSERNEARAELAIERDNARQSREEIEALKGDVAAAQSEATALRVSWQNAEEREKELREALERIVSMIGDFDNVPFGPQRLANAARAALANKEGQR